MSDKLKSEAVSSASIVKTPLTPPEELELSRCEQIVHKGKETFVEVGNALLIIRDKRLYRSTHDTFEHYCREKWDVSARQANRLIGAGGVVENLKRDTLVSNAPLAIPENAAQALPLAKLKPEQQVEVAKQVAKKTSKPKTKDFEEEAAKITEEVPRIKTYDTKDANADEGKVKTSSMTNIKKANDREALEILLELVDEAETQAKKVVNAGDVPAMLKNVAKAITRLLNGGAK